MPHDLRAWFKEYFDARCDWCGRDDYGSPVWFVATVTWFMGAVTGAMIALMWFGATR